MSEDEEDASYDVESLCANIFKELLLKLIAECTFSINEQLCNKSTVFPWEVHCLWFYQIVVIPIKPKFYK